MLHKDSHLYSEIVNSFVEFLVDAIGQASTELCEQVNNKLLF